MKNKGHIKLISEGLLSVSFIICALFTVLIGSGVLESITKRSDNSFEDLIVKEYIVNKVHENDKQGMIDVIQLDNTNVIEIRLGESSYSTYIYYYDGGLRELTADLNDGLGLQDGIKVLDCEEFNISKEGSYINIDDLKLYIKCYKN